MSGDEVLASKQYLSKIGQWPRIPARANPERWLNGFAPDDLAHAVALLESLIYFSMHQTTKLCTSVFHSLSNEVTLGCDTYRAKKAAWVSFLRNCIISFPTGETPNPTDSGHTFARLMRQELGIDESRFLYPEGVVSLLEKSPATPSVVMVDDFAGSGDQFIRTWQREYRTPNGKSHSLQSLYKDRPYSVFYMPTVATKYAADRIAAETPEVSLRCAHVLDSRYSAVSGTSLVFPKHLRAKSRDFIARYSAKAGILSTSELGWHDLALAVAFEHSVPDATVPLLWADTPTWNSLMRRS